MGVYIQVVVVEKIFDCLNVYHNIISWGFIHSLIIFTKGVVVAEAVSLHLFDYRFY